MQTIILALLFLLSAWPNSRQLPWREFSSPEGRFTTIMPAEQKTSLIATDTSEGKLTTHTLSSTDTDLNEYMVSWTEYPQESIEHKATEERFNRIRDALVGFKGGRVLSDSAVNESVHPAREVTFATSEGRVVRVRFYFVKNRFYQVMAESKERETGGVEAFFKAFKLLPGSGM
jgi:hypothetical protein